MDCKAEVFKHEDPSKQFLENGVSVASPLPSIVQFVRFNCV